ncbi:hypothetical protein [Streptomyces sp. NBC_00572]|uniref:hypothetical protein n=1 Tax=Streptomyces sp. NBC_00572 TaxID=2903664 RepID=UPI002257E6C2|nr:hypothetical protein [Streptomyces sp. NBC_00572]MCX4985890.1 hypothetical protein [Streptomyces sp. NBC_00572]
MDAMRREARARATERVDADLARPQGEAVPHLAVTVPATGAFAVVSLTLAGMTDDWWWAAPGAAAVATALAAVGHTRKVLCWSGLRTRGPRSGSGDRAERWTGIVSGGRHRTCAGSATKPARERPVGAAGLCRSVYGR